MRYLLLIFLCFVDAAQAAKIAVVTASIGADYNRMMQDCIENKRLYCEKHGYDFICGTENLDPSRPIPWTKLKILQQHLGAYDWVFWSDADSFIMHQSVCLEDLIDERYMLVVACDWNGLNTGQFLLKNCKESFELLEESYGMTQFIYHPCWEQTAIKQYLIDNPLTFTSVKLVPQTWINSYPPEIAEDHLESIYQPGDFIIHFPSARGHLLTELISQYKDRVLD